MRLVEIRDSKLKDIFESFLKGDDKYASPIDKLAIYVPCDFIFSPAVSRKSQFEFAENFTNFVKRSLKKPMPEKHTDYSFIDKIPKDECANPFRKKIL